MPSLLDLRSQQSSLLSNLAGQHQGLAGVFNSDLGAGQWHDLPPPTPSSYNFGQIGLAPSSGAWQAMMMQKQELESHRLYGWEPPLNFSNVREEIQHEIDEWLEDWDK